ncbi:MAG: histidine phosphatase family protein [Firmicutes bacterium]|nr:histidine phosphatase family protein [Bacillota bacterium]
MRILLARHGQTAANAAGRFQGTLDFPLNAKGRKQAQQLAPLLAQYTPGKLFTSNLRRSIETAAPTAHLLGIEPTASPVFREYSWGILEGLSRSEIKEQHPVLFSQLDVNLRGAEIPQQEPLEQFRERLRQGLALLLAEDNPCTVALVGHGRYLNALVVEFLGLDITGPWPFSFASAAVTLLEIQDDRRRLLQFNEECHLRGEQND